MKTIHDEPSARQHPERQLCALCQTIVIVVRGVALDAREVVPSQRCPGCRRPSRLDPALDLREVGLPGEAPRRGRARPARPASSGQADVDDHVLAALRQQLRPGTCLICRGRGVLGEPFGAGVLYAIDAAGHARLIRLDERTSGEALHRPHACAHDVAIARAA